MFDFLRYQIGNGGFTLLEMVTVIAIIGILATAGIGSYVGVREKARDTQRAATLQQLQIAIEAYKDTYGEYPDKCASSNSWAGSVRGGTFQCTDPNDDFIQGLVPEFIAELPRDPLYDSLPDNHGYLYRVDGTNESYKLLAYRTVESEIVTWGHPLARCPVQCNNSAMSPSPSCDESDPVFANFATTYGVYSTGTIMCR